MITAALPAVEALRESVVADVLRINASSIVKQHLHRQRLWLEQWQPMQQLRLKQQQCIFVSGDSNS
jgi:hypothetical protein